MSSIFYTKEHEWIRINEGSGVVGISAYASEQLGDVVFVELPENGVKANQGDNIAVVESVKAASEVYSPVSGEVIKTNEDLSVSPELVNEDPIGRGWFFEIKVSNPEELQNLMDEDSYKKFIEG
ncbi:MAG: glycine cleavage system protein GcvH [Pseudomonadota bacterium]|nr:glycine cleavage system protein GcvH [Pseudomonadota bacterium]